MLACDELVAFDYQVFKESGFKVKHLGDVDMELVSKPQELK